MTAGASPSERPPKPHLPPFVGLPDLPALRELQGRPKWVAWDYTWNEKRQLWDKPPISARDGRAGSSTNAETWSPYDAAAAYSTRRRLAGVGYVLSPDDDESGVDLDKCRDPETGTLQAWAQVAVDFAETYTEISPSGRGLRFFIRGLVDGRKIDAAQVEIYTEGRYLTVTGRHVAGTPTEIREAPRLVAYLQERADQFKAAARAAADLAREQERKKSDRRAERQPDPSPRPTTSERASAGAKQRGPREGNDFWRTVNDRALSNLGSWVPSVFPSARWQSGTGAYRVEQGDIGGGYEEDLSLHPDGIRDFGVGDMGDARDGARSPIDIVEAYLPTSDATAAAMWLCDRIGVRPEDLGWRGSQRADEGPRAGAQAEAEPATGAAGERKRIRATPFVYRDPRTIPPREWLYGRHLIRRFLSTTVAPGAVGKSSLVLVEAIAMVTGRPLLGITPPRPMRVWYANLEDPLEETERRVAAICLHYGIEAHELEGRLFLDSGRTAEIIIATRQRDGVKIAEPVIEDLTISMAENAIDHMVIDPFVSSHRVTENANDEIDIVAKAWNRGRGGRERVDRARAPRPKGTGGPGRVHGRGRAWGRRAAGSSTIGSRAQPHVERSGRESGSPLASGLLPRRQR